LTLEYLFGPVPSRRLGLSLGVDLVPHKTCSLNCVYCECGPTTRLSIDRREWVPTPAVISELDRFLEPGPRLDFVTFSGSGEPTLHKDLGKVARHIKQRHPAYQVALLTNGTLLFRPDVAADAMAADVVMASLDAGTPEAFQAVNRPHPQLDLEMVVRGLEDFSRGYTGELWLEVFLVPGLNDSAAQMKAVRRAAGRIQNARVVINTLDRPGAEAWVQPAPAGVVEHARRLLGGEAPGAAGREAKAPGAEVDRDRLLHTIRRRPCTEQDLVSAFAAEPERIRNILLSLEREGRIQKEMSWRGVFYRTANEPAP